MISEAELMELSFPDAPQMVTEVPGPKVSELMAESARYEAFTRGGAGFPVILEHGKGATAKATVLNDVVTGIILDTTAATFVRDTSGQKPTDKLDVEGKISYTDALKKLVGPEM